jgi:hypothetical protein
MGTMPIYSYRCPGVTAHRINLTVILTVILLDWAMPTLGYFKGLTGLNLPNLLKIVYNNPKPLKFLLNESTI